MPPRARPRLITAESEPVFRRVLMTPCPHWIVVLSGPRDVLGNQVVFTAQAWVLTREEAEALAFDAAREACSATGIPFDPDHWSPVHASIANGS